MVGNTFDRMADTVDTIYGVFWDGKETNATRVVEIAFTKNGW